MNAKRRGQQKWIGQVSREYKNTQENLKELKKSFKYLNTVWDQHREKKVVESTKKDTSLRDDVGVLCGQLLKNIEGKEDSDLAELIDKIY